MKKFGSNRIKEKITYFKNKLIDDIDILWLFYYGDEFQPYTKVVH